MITECFSIVLILLALMIIFLRARKPKHALITLPLLIVPLFHIVIVIFSPNLVSLLNIQKTNLIIIFNTSILIISCILLGAFSNFLMTKKAKLTYLISCGMFLFLLSWLLTINVLV